MAELSGWFNAADTTTYWRLAAAIRRARTSSNPAVLEKAARAQTELFALVELSRYASGQRLPDTAAYWRASLYKRRARTAAHAPELGVADSVCDRFLELVRRGRPADAPSPDSPLSLTSHGERSLFLPPRRRALFRKVLSCSCCYGARAALGDMATPQRFEHLRREAQKTIDFYAAAVPVLLALEPQASVLHGFGHPGGGALGSQRVGLPATILDNAVSQNGSPNLDDSAKWFAAPANTRVLVNVVHGDALSDAARSKAATSHPSHPLCVANLDTPPCTPVSNVTALNPSRAAHETPAHRCLLSCLARCEEELRTSSRPYFVETTPGGVNAVGRTSSCLVRGIYFAIRTHDAHRIAYSLDAPLILDNRLRQIGCELARSTCAGASRPISPLHPDGTPLKVPCCVGQLKSFYGSGYRGQLHTELCAALEIDRRHITSRSRLNNALPPVIGALLSAQLAVHRLFLAHGVPFISEDEVLADPRLDQWRNGLFRMLRAGDLPPLPIRRCFVICAPRTLQSVVVSSRSEPLIFDIPSISVPTTRLVEAAATQLGLSASQLHFVSDCLNSRSSPALLFYTSFLPDPILQRLLERGGSDMEEIIEPTTSPTATTVAVDGLAAHGRAGEPAK